MKPGENPIQKHLNHLHCVPELAAFFFICLNLVEYFGIEAALKVSRVKGSCMVVLPVLVAFTVLNWAQNYAPGHQRPLFLVPSSCHLILIHFSSRCSLLSPLAWTSPSPLYSHGC